MCERILTDSNKIEQFNNILSKTTKPVFVLFWQEWCPACLYFHPKFMKYVKSCSVDNKRVMIVINGKSAPELFDKYKITSFPTVLIFKNNKIINRIVGADIDELDKFYKMYS